MAPLDRPKDPETIGELCDVLVSQDFRIKMFGAVPGIKEELTRRRRLIAECIMTSLQIDKSDFNALDRSTLLPDDARIQVQELTRWWTEQITPSS